MRKIITFAALTVSTLSMSTIATATPPAADSEADRAASTGSSHEEQLEKIRVPFEIFTLANGLRVIVHEDRKAPIVAVGAYYDVGSRDEPAGRTGFAHLFEHLMFNGSENAPGDFFKYLTEIGAGEFNGTTDTDRTNYYETVPTGALERVLFLESDRMGHLLGAVTQETLANQIGVVRNEKRQGDNSPFGMARYTLSEALFPKGHPYHHSTIGSMADISAATLDTVKDWFHSKYGPNNAVLLLSGDIDAKTARPLVERYFGAIPRGPAASPPGTAVPILAKRVDLALHDQVANTRIYRSWIAPPATDSDIPALDVGLEILGGGAGSRFAVGLERGDKSASGTGAWLKSMRLASTANALVDIRPGQDVAAVQRRFDEIIAELIKNGPTQEEIDRVVQQQIVAKTEELEHLLVKGNTLAMGMLTAGDPAFQQKQFEQLARISPAQVRAALQRWLNRPFVNLIVSPGKRETYEEAPVEAPAVPAVARPAMAATAAMASRPLPPIEETKAPGLPPVERARLSNGIELYYAQRRTVPMTRLHVEFDAGIAADTSGHAGLQDLMLDLLDEGTAKRSANQLIDESERLGARINSTTTIDRSRLTLTTLTANLTPSLDLFADIIRNPAFAPAEIERLRGQSLADIAARRTDPASLAKEAMQSALYGDYPYGRSRIGDGDAIRAVTRDEIVDLYQRWIRPDNARIFVVSDLPLEQIKTRLEAQFGSWKASGKPLGRKTFDTTSIPAPRPRVILIDRPQSPQSMIMAGQVLTVEGAEDLLELNAAVGVVTGGFLARLNMDLREQRGWSYGAYGGVASNERREEYVITVPVEVSRTGESIAAARDLIDGFLGSDGVQPAELKRVVDEAVGPLPGKFAMADSVLSAMVTDNKLRRPADYWAKLADRYRALTANQLDQNARSHIDPAKFVWVVVGDAARVRPQLEKLGLPIEERPLP